jgi:hypothetical protein
MNLLLFELKKLAVIFTIYKRSKVMEESSSHTTLNNVFKRKLQLHYELVEEEKSKKLKLCTVLGVNSNGKLQLTFAAHSKVTCLRLMPDAYSTNNPELAWGTSP